MFLSVTAFGNLFIKQQMEIVHYVPVASLA
jgi:hypothetical protein